MVTVEVPRLSGSFDVRVVAAFLIASALASSRGRPKSPYAAPRFVSVLATIRVVAAVRPLLDRERALQHVSRLWSQAGSLNRRTPSRGSQQAGDLRPYARSLIASARSSMSRAFAWSPKAPYAALRFVSVATPG